MNEDEITASVGVQVSVVFSTPNSVNSGTTFAYSVYRGNNRKKETNRLSTQ